MFSNESCFDHLPMGRTLEPVQISCFVYATGPLYGKINADGISIILESMFRRSLIWLLQVKF